MAYKAQEQGRQIAAKQRYHERKPGGVPDIARGNRPYYGQVEKHRQQGNIALGTKLPPADFKPFRAFSPKRKSRGSRRIDTMEASFRGTLNDPTIYERLAEPIMRPDWYRLEQFVPLMRTW
eukprot:SAG22_NODE_4845_length_1152_cov_0.882241_1_plen_121_part_00